MLVGSPIRCALFFGSCQMQLYAPIYLPNGTCARAIRSVNLRRRALLALRFPPSALREPRTFTCTILRSIILPFSCQVAKQHGYTIPKLLTSQTKIGRGSMKGVYTLCGGKLPEVVLLPAKGKREYPQFTAPLRSG